jgi:hypothetical protein
MLFHLGVLWRLNEMGLLNFRSVWLARLCFSRI